jgi:Rab family protein
LESNVPNKVFKYIFANKCDLSDARVISQTEGEAYAREHEAEYFETSALNGRGIEKGIRVIAEDLMEHHLLSLNDNSSSIENITFDKEQSETTEKQKSSSSCCAIS